MRTLNKTVLAGGVVYPAGTPATPELEKRITNPAHWDGEPTETDAGAETDRYKGWKVDQLRGEIEQRNSDREPEGENYIVPEEPGNKPELLAALQADDVRTADAEQA